MSQAVLFEGRASDTEVMCHNQFAPMTMQFGMTGAKTVIEGSHEHEGTAGVTVTGLQVQGWRCMNRTCCAHETSSSGVRSAELTAALRALASTC